MAATRTEIPSPFPSYKGSVLPEWIDLNGHMNIAYYVMAFDQGTDALFDYMGIDSRYREQENCSTFTIELHVNYLREIKEGDAFEIDSQVLGVDHKRLHVFHTMRHIPSGDLVATNENMFIHIDMATRRSAPFPASLFQWLEEISRSHATLPHPENAGRSIGFRG